MASDRLVRVYSPTDQSAVCDDDADTDFCDEESRKRWAEVEQRVEIAELSSEDRELVRSCLQILGREYLRTLPAHIATHFVKAKGRKRRKVVDGMHIKAVVGGEEIEKDQLNVNQPPPSRKNEQKENLQLSLPRMLKPSRKTAINLVNRNLQHHRPLKQHQSIWKVSMYSSCNCCACPHFKHGRNPSHLYQIIRELFGLNDDRRFHSMSRIRALFVGGGRSTDDQRTLDESEEENIESEDPGEDGPGDERKVTLL